MGNGEDSEDGEALEEGEVLEDDAGDLSSMW